MWIISLIVLHWAISETFTVQCPNGLIDLSHDFDDRTITWPGNPKFRLSVVQNGTTDGGWHYASNNIALNEHSGTHLDAPSHFAAGGWTTDAIPLQRLRGRVCLLDVTRQANADPDYMVSVADAKEWEARHGRIGDICSILLVRTGLGEVYPDRAAYLGSAGEDPALFHFPGLSSELAQWLVRERRGVTAVGVDTASLDRGQSRDFGAHVALAGANVAGLENLANLRCVGQTGWWVDALPMKIAGGSGGPLRAVAYPAKLELQVTSSASAANNLLFMITWLACGHIH